MEVLRGYRSTNSRPINSENSDTQPESRKKNGWKTFLKVGQGFGRRRRIIQVRSSSLCSHVILSRHKFLQNRIHIISYNGIKESFSVMERYLALYIYKNINYIYIYIYIIIYIRNNINCINLKSSATHFVIV